MSDYAPSTPAGSPVYSGVVAQQRQSGYVEVEKQAYQGLLSNTTATLYTAPAAPTLGPPPKARIVEILVANTDSSARTVTIYVVPNGGSAGDSTTILPGVSVAANSFTRIELTTTMEASGLIRGKADTGSKVNVTITVKELFPRQT